MTMANKKLKILNISRWYPNRYDPMPGLFIQRHAEAVALFAAHVSMVYVHAVAGLKKYEVDKQHINGVDTIKVYYPEYQSKLPGLGTFVRLFRYYKANLLAFKYLDVKASEHDLLHIHILSRPGLIALFYKIFFHKPFIISEHWSRYQPNTYGFNGFLRKLLTRIIVKKASIVTTVTRHLANAMKKHKLDNDDYRVLANVLSPDFLNTKIIEKKQSDKIKIVHISCFEDKSKNVSGILRVIKNVSAKRDDIEFCLIGDGMDFISMKNYASELKIDNSAIEFTGLLEGKALVEKMKDADALLLFSNYENFPVVINEALSLGIPVISSRVGGIAEYLDEEKGILIKAGDEKALENAIVNFTKQHNQYDRKKLSEIARVDFSMENIGMELMEIYSDAIM